MSLGIKSQFQYYASIRDRLFKREEKPRIMWALGEGQEQGIMSSYFIIFLKYFYLYNLYGSWATSMQFFINNQEVIDFSYHFQRLPESC